MNLSKWVPAIFTTVILAGVTALMFPVSLQARDAARMEVPMTDINHLLRSIALYTESSDQHYPPMMTSAFAVEPYLIHAGILDAETVYSIPRKCISYDPKLGDFRGDARNNGLNSSLLEDPAMTLLFYDPALRHGKRLYSYANGRYGYDEAALLDTMLSKQRALKSRL